MAAKKGPSKDDYEQTMQRPKSFAAASNGFFGDTRVYRRQRFYRADDSDLNAKFHSTLDEKVANDSLLPETEDPYEEGGYVAIEEKPAAIEQFRSDLTDARFRSTIERNRNTVVDPDGGDGGDEITEAMRIRQEAREREARTRTEIIRAMERAQRQQSLFTVDYARCVPPEFIKEFLFGLEAATVCQALVPMLLVRQDELRYHLEEGQLRRVLFDVGCHFERGDTIVLKGHMRDHVPLPPAENGWYTEDVVESEHAHPTPDDDTTVMRVLIFQIPTAAADAEGAQLQEVSDAAGYRVKVVCHMVTQHAKQDIYNVLCFRTFYFSRYA